MRAIITGANRGIGLELAKLYHERGYKVWALCRSGSLKLKAVSDLIIEGVDVTNVASLQKAEAELPNEKVNVLINNAGVLIEDNLESAKAENLRTQFEVNSIGPFNVTQTFLARFDKGSKIGMITSMMGSIDDNKSGGYYGYRASKAALNIISKSLAVDLKDRGVAVALLHPGYVQTRMTNFLGSIDPETSAKGLFHRMEQLTLANSGKFWDYSGKEIPW